MTEIVDRPAGCSVTRSPDELEPIETASRDEISALQLIRLKWSLQHAYDNVTHYRKAFDQAGVHPSEVKDLGDLALFPFTTKADLRNNYPFGMFAVPQSQVARVHASSGTTGRPTVVGYTAADIETWANLVARCLRAAACDQPTRFTSPMATACSPADWEPTTAQSVLGAPSFRSRAA